MHSLDRIYSGYGEKKDIKKLFFEDGTAIVADTGVKLPVIV